MSPLSSPLKPLNTPKTVIFFLMAVLVTALIAAFMPGASPPLVKTPIFFIYFLQLCRSSKIQTSLSNILYFAGNVKPFRETRSILT
jgi:hypothetical protein